MKTCTTCNVPKPPSNYYQRVLPTGRSSSVQPCKACKKVASARYDLNRAPKDPAYSRRRHLQTSYGITLEQYEDMLEKQNSVCLICTLPSGTRRLHVDHNHDTGKVRGLLCHHCNTALGLLRDDPALLAKAATYLLEKGNYS